MSIDKIKQTSRRRKIWRVLMAILALAVAAGVFFVWLKFVPATTVQSEGRIYYEWSSSILTESQSVDLDLRIDPEVAVETVMAKVEYDPDRLKYESVSYEGSDFTTQIPAIVKDDSVMVQSAILGGETTNKETRIAKLTFESKKSQQPSVKLTGNSAKAGVAKNPSVDGSFIDSSLLKQPVYLRVLISLALAIVAVLVGWIVYQVIKKSRLRRTRTNEKNE